MTLSTIIAAIDLSAPSALAVDRAAALAQLHGAKLVLVHALADDAPIENVGNDVLQQLGEVSAAMRAEIAKRLAEQLAALRAQGIDGRARHADRPAPARSSRRSRASAAPS